MLYEGQIVAQYTPDVSEEEIGFAMVGGKKKATAA